MLKLGVNIDHVATLREARYRGMKNGEPSPVDAALTCEAAGAHGFLVGESLMRQSDVEAATRALLAR